MCGEGKMKQQAFLEASLNPSDRIKRYIVDLSKECADHLEKSEDNDKERHAFAMKVEVFSIMLEPYTSEEIKNLTRDSYKNMEEEIIKIKGNDLYNESTKKKNIIKQRFDYALPVFWQSLRILQNSPIVEIESEGIIDFDIEGVKKRVRSSYTSSPDVDVKPVRGE